MQKVKIHIADKTYNVQLAQTDDQKEKGLQGVTELPEDEGMLFIFEDEDPDYDGTVSFWMKDTQIPLDIIFIDEDLTVISVHQGTPESEEQIVEDNVAFVLEINQGSGIVAGDELEFSSDKKINKDKMQVLDSNGETQMELDGGERIFSRKHTKTLIKFAKKASITQNDNDYKTLGKRVFKFLQTQEETEPEYVKSKN